MKSLRVEGKDAAEFLQRLTATGVTKLGVGQGSRGLLLSGQSKMVAQFDLLRVDEKKFLLVAPDECFAPLAEGLERLHFAEDLILQAADAYSFVKGESQGELIFPLGDDFPSAVPGYRVQKGAAAAAEEFHFSRIGALVPWPNLDWTPDTNALEAGALPWIDRYKGCYPGQEVVEKSLNLGHPARVLVAVEGVGHLSAGEKIGAGTVTSVAKKQATRALVRFPWKERGQDLPGFRRIKSQF